MAAEDTLCVPDSKRLANVQQLCELTAPYKAGPEQDELFVKAMREIVAWHRDKCAFYNALLLKENFTLGQLDKVSDCIQLPLIHANFFKTHEVMSIDRDKVYLHLTSSGTTGQKSQMFFDKWSIEAGRRMVDFVFQYHEWVTPDSPVNYIDLGYEQEQGSHLGTANTMNFLCKYAPINHVHYALRRIGGGLHEPDIFGCIDRLEQYAEQGKPVRLIGFPAYFYFILKRMSDLSRPALKLHPASLVFLGGGWKGFADRKIEESEIYGLSAGRLGIPDNRIRSFFGSLEHSVPYIECEYHHLHIPVWSRVFIRDVKTLEPVGYGSTGFLNFVSPYITSAPAMSILMGDLAVLYDGSSCPCDVKTDYFKVLGRAGTSRNRSCAVAAAELLKGA